MIKVSKCSISLSLAIVLMFPVALAAESPAKAPDSFKRLCASCHGDSGKGDGPVGRSLPPGTIPDLTTDALKYSTSDERMAELIRKGGMGVGLSPMMPPQPGIKDEDIAAIVEFVNSIRAN